MYCDDFVMVLPLFGTFLKQYILVFVRFLILLVCFLVNFRGVCLFVYYVFVNCLLLCFKWRIFKDRDIWVHCLERSRILCEYGFVVTSRMLSLLFSVSFGAKDL